MSVPPLGPAVDSSVGDFICLQPNLHKLRPNSLRKHCCWRARQHALWPSVATCRTEPGLSDELPRLTNVRYTDAIQEYQPALLRMPPYSKMLRQGSCSLWLGWTGPSFQLCPGRAARPQAPAARKLCRNPSFCMIQACHLLQCTPSCLQ